jgi:uncharacterized protein (TIGR02246 family)
MLIVGCSPPAAQDNTEADVAAINAVRDREITLVVAGNIDSLVALYTPDVAMMPPNEPAVNGQDALRTWTEAMVSQATVSGRYTSSEVTVSGDWAVDRYAGVLTATPKAGGAPMEEQIKGVHIMKRGTDGVWRIAQDVWNTDAPPPPPPAPAKQ